MRPGAGLLRNTRFTSVTYLSEAAPAILNHQVSDPDVTDMTLPHFQDHMQSYRHERREMRFPLHLPVVLKPVSFMIARPEPRLEAEQLETKKDAREEICVRSENISLGGILLSSDRRIPEGATVEVAVGVRHTADPGILLSARGKVLRVQAKSTGEFAVAIRLERSFQLPFGTPRPTLVSLPGSVPRVSIQKPENSPESGKTRPVFYRAPYLTGWHTET